MVPSISPMEYQEKIEGEQHIKRFLQLETSCDTLRALVQAEDKVTWTLLEGEEQKAQAVTVNSKGKSGYQSMHWHKRVRKGVEEDKSSDKSRSVLNFSTSSYRCPMRERAKHEKAEEGKETYWDWDKALGVRYYYCRLNDEILMTSQKRTCRDTYSGGSYLVLNFSQMVSVARHLAEKGAEYCWSLW